MRGFETVGDMLRSLAVVGAFVAVLLAVTLRQTPDPVTADAAPVAAAVSEAAPFKGAVVPGPVPPDWTTTSARVTLPTARPYSWYVGYQIPGDQFVAVSQVYGPNAGEVRAYLEGVAADGDPAGTVSVDGREWAKVEQPDGSRRALVLADGEVTTVVVGTAGFDVLARTAAALRPA